MVNFDNRHFFVSTGTASSWYLSQLTKPIMAIKERTSGAFNPVFIAIDSNGRVEDVIRGNDNIQKFCLEPRETNGQGSGTNPRIAFDAWLSKRDEFVETFGLEKGGIQSVTTIAALNGGTAPGIIFPVCWEFVSRDLAAVPFLMTPPTVGNVVGSCQRDYCLQALQQFDDEGIPLFEASGNWIYERYKDDLSMSQEQADEIMAQQFKDALLKIALFWVWGTMVDPADIKGRLLRKRPGAAPRLTFAESEVDLGDHDCRKAMKDALDNIKAYKLYRTHEFAEVVFPFTGGTWSVPQNIALSEVLEPQYGSKAQFSKTARDPNNIYSDTCEKGKGKLALLVTTVTALASTEREIVPRLADEQNNSQVAVNQGTEADKKSVRKVRSRYTYHYRSLRELFQKALNKGSRSEAQEARNILLEGDPWKLREEDVINKRDAGRPIRLFYFETGQSTIGAELVEFGEGEEWQKLPLLEMLIAIQDSTYQTLSASWQEYILGGIAQTLLNRGEWMPRYIARGWDSVKLFDSRELTADKLRNNRIWELQWQKWRRNGDSRARLLLLKVVLENLFGSELVAERLPQEPEETRALQQRVKDASWEWVQSHGLRKTRRKLQQFAQLFRQPQNAAVTSLVVQAGPVVETEPRVNGHPPVPVEELAKTQVSSTVQ